MVDWYNGEIPSLHWADYLVFVLFLLISAGIGIFFGYRSKKQDVEETAKSFLTGGGEMHFFPVSLSMMASFLSAIFVLSIPAEMMTFGHHYVYLGIAYLSGYGIAAHVHLPIYYRLGVTSGYEYLEKRFNRTVRIAGALTFSAMSFLYLSVVLYTPALALSQVTGLPMLASILGVGAVCTFYTALGGMRATIWNDTLQMIIVFACFILLIAVGTARVGNIQMVMDYARDGGRLTPNFSPDPFIRSTFWTHTIGGTFVNLTLYASSQTIIQKFLSTKSIREGQKAVWLSCFVTGAGLIMVMILGMVMYTFFADCDPVATKRAEKSDQIVPLFVMLIIGKVHGVPGLFLASAFSAALSTVSGSVNALSAVFLEDLIHPVYVKIRKRKMSARIGTIVTRSLSVLFGLLTIAMSFVAEFLGPTVIQIALSVFGMIGSPLMAILTLGMLLPWINSWVLKLTFKIKGAFFGLLGSLGITCWVGFGRIVLQIPNIALDVSTAGCNMTTTAMPWASSTADMGLTTEIPPSMPYLKIYDLSYMYYSVLALLTASAIAIPISLLTGCTKGRTLDPRLFYLLPNECWCSCCPAFCSRFFLCCYSSTGGAEEPLDEWDRGISRKNITELNDRSLKKDSAPIHRTSYRNEAYLHSGEDQNESLRF